MSATPLATSPDRLVCACAGGRVQFTVMEGLLRRLSCTHLSGRKLFIKPPDARSSIGKTSCRCSSTKRSRRDKRWKDGAKLKIDEGSSGTGTRPIVSEDPSQEIETAPDSLLLANNSPAPDMVPISPRGNVLQACTLTSGTMAALGLIIREGSHFASTRGLPVVDCTTQVSFGFEMWHLELITGLVVLISSSRYLLLKAWPEFSESSEAANRQVLTSLKPLDYLIVSFFPGISEEILFCGALLPIFGINWVSIMAVGALFGVLHLGNGRNYSFAIWATFVGLAYGYAAVISSSMWVPVLSHSLNNLAGGIFWRLKQEPSLK
ncbi:hypothetical protein MLD38_009393 [Melastoma candidum]|uniref:Uncharacterized protein n=1 Tax=Melastoma candidum TaxID=119954 RepID=A0ACB9S5W9_9MYRT|nr:hypothetical protein MLD38_009393 [Melastoma candidum]